jgi:hypothetical protein
MDPKTTNGGIGQYVSLTSTNGWVSTNAALLIGGASDSNPAFKFIGSDNTVKAVTINGKTAAAGSLVSPILTGGIEKLVFNYGYAFKESNGLDITITITEVATGAVQTIQLVKSNSEVVQKTAYTAEFVLENPISGEFTISFTNNCPSNNASSNKDRVSLWNIQWTGYEKPQTSVEQTVSFNVFGETGVLAEDAQSISWSNENFNIVAGKGTASATLNIHTTATDHFRVYAGFTFEVASKNEEKMTKVVITFKTEGYAQECINALKTEGITAIQEGTTVTFTASAGSFESLYFAEGKQFRVMTIEITYLA